MRKVDECEKNVRGKDKLKVIKNGVDKWQMMEWNGEQERQLVESTKKSEEVIGAVDVRQGLFRFFWFLLKIRNQNSELNKRSVWVPKVAYTEGAPRDKGGSDQVLTQTELRCRRQ